jgi:hypothetical protein
MSATLEEDLLEIEQTLKAVEQRLLIQTAAGEPKPSVPPSSSSIVKEKKITRSFRGINKISQGPKKSLLLNRAVSLSAKNKKNTKPLTDASAPPPYSAKFSDSSIERLLPSLSSIVRARIKLKVAKLNRPKSTKPLNQIRSISIDDTATNKPVKNAVTPQALKKQPSRQKLSLTRAKKGKLVNKFNSKNSGMNQIKNPSNLVLVKSAKVKRSLEPHSNNASSKRRQPVPALSKQNMGSFVAVSSNAKVSSPKTTNKSEKTKMKPPVRPPQFSSKIRSHNLKEELIKNALSEVPMEHYYDHDKHRSLKKKYKIRSIRNLSLAAFVLIFSGYLLFLNMPSISFRVAAIQAGMSSTAALPAYKPAGYSLSSKASYGSGYVKIEMKNKIGNKLKLTQEKSSFDSGALRDNVVARVQGGYSTYVKDGLTIYLYNNGGASWVNKGQVYGLTGDTSDLSSDEILNMAVSM